jgi:hypothetical protein
MSKLDHWETEFNRLQDDRVLSRIDAKSDHYSLGDGDLGLWVAANPVICKQHWGACSCAPRSSSVLSYALRFTPHAPQRGNKTPETFLIRIILTPQCC